MKVSTIGPMMTLASNGKVYIFAIFRQAGPVQLKAGLNGSLCKQWQGQTITTSSNLWEKWAGYLTSPANQYREKTVDGAHGLSSLSEKTRI